jgi:acetate kinase
MREIIKQAKAGNKRCQLAIDMFAYRVRKYIGACAAALDGLDVIVFTAGIGSNSPIIRSIICAGLDFLGVTIDPAKNVSAIDSESEVSAVGSKVRVLVIPTNEEKLIATETMEIVAKATKDTILVENIPKKLGPYSL